MCALCGVTNMPVCVVDGSCVLVAQQAATAGLVTSVGVYALWRERIVNFISTIRARIRAMLQRLF